jgi:hypothetical protein
MFSGPYLLALWRHARLRPRRVAAGQMVDAFDGAAAHVYCMCPAYLGVLYQIGWINKKMIDRGCGLCKISKENVREIKWRRRSKP